MLSVFTLFFCITPSALANSDVKDVIEDIVQWKKQKEHKEGATYLLQAPFVEHAGQGNVDWYAFGLGRVGITDDFATYQALLHNNVAQRYETEDKLSKTKATEWHRIILATLATGGDPTHINEINLVKDGVYDRTNQRALGAQGINGWIWGLIAIDSMRYQIPKEAAINRERILQNIMALQQKDGGFALSEGTSDVDLTAMAIQALAPYYNETTSLTYHQKYTQQKRTATVSEVVDEALMVLQQLQQPDGSFTSYGQSNTESIAQVIVALTSLGLAHDDERFTQHGTTLYEALLTYQQKDGGFIHAAKYDATNPSSQPDESNDMASEQALYALAAIMRQQLGYRTLYDLRPEISEDIKQQINVVNAQIQALPQVPTQDQIAQVLQQYKQVPIEERSYVNSFATLQSQLSRHQLALNEPPLWEAYNIATQGKGNVTSLMTTASESLSIDVAEQQFAQLPKLLTTEQYVDVIALLQVFEEANRPQEVKQLQQMKTEIEQIQLEIDAINEEVLDKLYPFSALTLDDKHNVEAIVTRYNKLAPYDQQKVLSHEDIEKSQVQMKNLERAKWIKVSLIIVSGLLAIIVVGRIIRRRMKQEA